MAARDTIWARFYEDRAEIGFSERGEHPADVDILFDINVVTGNAGHNVRHGLVQQVDYFIRLWQGEGAFTMEADSGDEVPF